MKVHSRAYLFTVRPQGRISSGLPIALAVLLALSMLTLDSCKKPPTKQNPADTTAAAPDTSKSFLTQKYDSLTNTFSSFFKSLLPPGKDTTKGEIVVSSPPTETTSPAVTPETPGEPGFLNTPVKRKTEFDSSGQVVQHDQFLGTDIRTPSSSSLMDYLTAQENEKIMEGYNANIHKLYDTGQNIETTTGILGDYNTIQIPIPPSIVPTIFGRPSINLKVNGDVAIHLAYRDQQTYATAGANFYGDESGLDFKQEINVSTSGTIGDKLKIGADWGSDRMFQYDNLLKFTYTGYPDEILQEFDAGNVTFTTPSQYIGTQQDLFGLKAITRFGPLYVTTVAAQKKGERQSKSFGGGAGTATDHQIKPWQYRRNRYWLDTSFIQFYEPYSAHIPRNIGAVTGSGKEYIAPGTKVEVWMQTIVATDPNRRKGTAWYHLQPIAPSGTYNQNLLRTGPPQPGDSVVTGYWDLLDSNRYYVEPYTGILVLNQEPEDTHTALAVSYQTTTGNGGGSGNQYGEQSMVTDSPLVLKLIKPQNTFQSPSTPWWNNIVKNSYYIGGVNFSSANFTGRIFVQQPGGHQDEYMLPASGNAPQKAISVMGLDRYNNSEPSSQSPDGLVDFGTEFTQDDFVIDPKTGTIVFPYIQPFGNRITSYNALQHRLDPKFKDDTNFSLPEIYNTSQDALNLRETKLVTIDVKFTGGVSSTLNLNAFNLVQGSVRVTIGGTPLVEGTDFRVDYNSGTVTILNPDLLNTGTINIDYDVHDIFTNATKNVLAMRAEVPLLDHGVIGTTLMNYSMSLPTLKTVQGEEPMSNWIWGMDGSYRFDTPWLTDALNALPIFNLKDKSELTVRVDGAVSMPNPNTDVSPMPADNGASIAYLDDFEGGLNEFPLYLNYGKWVPSSQPADSLFVAQHPTTADTLYWNNAINKLKMKTMWDIPVSLPAITDIENEETAVAGQSAQVMDITFDPSQPGIYNPYPNVPALNTGQMWGGCMQYTPGLNVAATNTDAIQMWVQIQSLDPIDLNTATLRFDIGRMSSDIIPNGLLNTEDWLQNGVYAPGEDVGLDWMTTAQEQKFFSPSGTGGAQPWNVNDPSNDDYSANTSTYPDSINGQEGNEEDAYSGLKPDTEDLEGTGSVNLDNAYYEYEIPLDLPKNKYVIGVGNNVKSWYQLRIPLADFKRLVGTTDSTFSNISYFRFWINGIQKLVSVRFYDVELVGSQWTRGTIGLNPINPVTDTSLKIGYVNIEENGSAPTNYYKPPGAAQQTVPASTTYILGNEQSLNMQVSCVGDTGRREAQRVFPTPNDIFNYRAMAIWAHGDESKYSVISNAPIVHPSDTLNRVWIYWRFGSDQFDYYEYRRPLVRGWQNLHVDFSTLTALKAQMSQNQYVSKLLPDPNGGPGATFQVIGQPTLTNAPYFVLGLQNESGQSCLTTEVWWDELRLLDANDKDGYAWNTSAKLKLAEFGNITAGIADQSADFHQVDERFNTSRSSTLNWNITGEFNAEKMLPKSMEDKGSKLPITISHAESLIDPEYIVNTDESISSTIAATEARTDITGAQKQEIVDSISTNNNTLQVKNSFGANNIALRFPGSFFLIPAFVNRLTFGYGYTEGFLRSPEYQYDRTWSWTGSARYSLPPLPGLGLEPFKWWGNTTILIGPYADWKINLLPSNVSFAIAATRARDNSLEQLSTLSLPPEGSTTADTQAVLNSRVPLINRVFTATRGMAITWKPFEGGMLTPTFDYSLDVTSNLAGLETDAYFNQPTTYDANGNPIYNYDSVYLYQRSTHDILNDIFFNNGALVRPGQDFNASQKIHMGTLPRLPGMFGLEKFIRPVFDYKVEYKWLDAQTNLQNEKQGAWNNVITTGVEFNVKEIGNLIFGTPPDDKSAQQPPSRGRGRGERGAPLGTTPEELPEQPGGATLEPTPNPQQDATRNQIERGEDMRPQQMPNPLGRSKYITDTLRNPSEVVPPIDTAGKIHTPGVGTAGVNDREYVVDTILTPQAPPSELPTQAELAEVKPPVTAKSLFQNVIQKPLTDWNGTRFNFVQTNSTLNNALAGDGSGITNFFDAAIDRPGQASDGPSLPYQLGLITDPAGRLLFHWHNTFPYLTYSVVPGLRQDDPFGGSVDVVDAFTQTNSFELTTSRPLWSGATINLNWKLSFGFNERDALHINDLGEDSTTYTAKSGDISRTFLSIPPLPFGLSNSGILKVGQIYMQKVEALGYTVDNARDSLTAQAHNTIEQEAFMEGFETLPFFQTALREYLPRLNYSFAWTGMEKFWLFSFADHVTFRDAYNGTYRRSFRQDPGDSVDLTSLQTIVYGFRPLIAFDATWDKIWNGKLTTSVNYDTQTQWAADYSSTRITRRLSTTFGITGNYSHEGLSVPFLKINLKNKVGASFTFSQTISQDSYYNFWAIDPNNPGGISDGGLTKTTIEPRITYDVSQQLTADAFYHYERTTPASSGLISPPTRLIEAGFDIKLKIQ